MKTVSMITGIIFLLYQHTTAQTNVTIADMPLGEYTVRQFSKEELSTLEQKSDDFSGLPKIASVDSLHPDGILSAEKWPEGAWGRGYQTWPKVKFYPKNAHGAYWACHPLVRDAAGFTQGHLFLYQYDTTLTTSKRLSMAGIDYLLDEQIKTGNEAGHFMGWFKREGLENLNMEKPINTIQPYETCYALVTLCTFYQSGIDYRKAEVKAAIDLSTEALVNINWLKDNLVGNSNMRGLGMWSLAEAYKVNPEKKIYNKLKKLTTYMLKNQNQDTTSENGLWHTGGSDNVDGYIIYHDTKIFYHLMVLRGLIASFSVIPDTDKAYKTNVADAIKRAVNHIILYRIDRNDPTNFKLRYASKTVDGKDTPYWFSHELIDADKVIEPLVKIACYSANSPYFSQAEHANLRKLAIQVGQALNPGEVWYVCALGYYLKYMNGANK